MKNVVKSVLFLIILFLLVEGISYFLIPQNNLKKYGLIKTSTYEILGEVENTIDAVVVGDSLIYSAISPMEVWHNYGYTMFDCANAAQLIKDSYKNVEIIIDSQHPKVIFFEANVLFRDQKNRAWYYDYYSKMENSLPIIKYHNNWKKILFNFLNNDSTFNKINVYKGFKYVTTIKPAPKKDYMKYTSKVKKVLEFNEEYFKKIKELCDENNVSLVLISTPNMKSWNYKKHNGAEELAQKYNVEFIDLNVDNPLNINWQMETKDKGDHLNFAGALKVSDFIGKYLKNSGLVIDHRNDILYSSWHEAYDIYEGNL